ARAAEGRAAPDAPGDELEGARRDLLARARDADDDRLAPALVAALERRAHDVDVADALEGVVGATARERHEVRDQVLAVVLGVDEVRHTEAGRDLAADGVEVHADDALGAHHPQALDDVEADAAEAEDHA